MKTSPDHVCDQVAKDGMNGGTCEAVRENGGNQRPCPPPIRGKIILFVIGIALITTIPLAAFGLFRFFDYEIESPQFAVLSSPDGNKLAYLILRGALVGRNLSLLVSETASDDDARWIGTVTSDDSFVFDELVWSKDSTLIVARCSVDAYGSISERTGNKFFFTHGYDFSRQYLIKPDEDGLGETTETLVSSDRQLAQLLLQKGGGVTSVSGQELPDKMRKMTWCEWRRWRHRIEHRPDKKEHKVEIVPSDRGHQSHVSTIDSAEKPLPVGQNP